MRARFLLGPAGSGKTYRCLEDIAALLDAHPEGGPLVFLAPKQATFQLERQLLSHTRSGGYTRLHILSFDRLARFILSGLRGPVFNLLDEEGRLMVLRSLLAKMGDELTIYARVARMPGFAQQVSQALRQFQQQCLGPDQLENLAAQYDPQDPLSRKLHDLAKLWRAYQQWLEERQLLDSDCLLDLAIKTLRDRKKGEVQSRAGRGEFQTLFVFDDPIVSSDDFTVESIWLDGFAELAPQELELLAHFIPLCQKATLAFCLESEIPGPLPALSPWRGIHFTYQRCRDRLRQIAGCLCEVEVLRRNHQPGRFSANPCLAHLERWWTHPRPFDAPAQNTAERLRPILRVAVCANADDEAVLAAQEILRFVRQKQGRYRQAAVLVRQLDTYGDSIRRVFHRYRIPFFLDRREPVVHHPLAELTRSALRTVLFHWPHEDWFSALKTGLVPASESDIDELENAALAFGWKRHRWAQELRLRQNPELASRLEAIRRRIMPPFEALARDLGVAKGSSRTPVPGTRLASALRRFWMSLRVEEQLKQWSLADTSAIHATVASELAKWLENIEMAFGDLPLPAAEWLPILEAGLSNLSVGVIPPALDQVLVGSVDRSRNPDLRLTLVLGVNEGVFPAIVGSNSLLTDTDCQNLLKAEINLAPSQSQRLGQEAFLGYVACTRGRERLVLTSSRVDRQDRLLNPSPFLDRLQRLFPNLEKEDFRPSSHWQDCEHDCELMTPLVQLRREGGPASPLFLELCQIPQLEARRSWLLQDPPVEQAITPALAEQLYGPRLYISVSRLEKYAACPFAFFVESGLGAEERLRFEPDPRRLGAFQHQALKIFHDQLQAEGRTWHSLKSDEARQRMEKIINLCLGEFEEGLLASDERARLFARHFANTLGDFIETIIGWMTRYRFEPKAAELEFSPKGPLPAWELPLENGHSLVFRGVIDRVDLLPIPGQDAAYCVVIDYKSSQRKIDELFLANGVQMQLPAYLSALRHLPNLKNVFGVSTLIPAGVFYVNLKGKFETGAHRDQVLREASQARQSAFRHFGRFDETCRPDLDAACQPGESSSQFNFRLKKDGQCYKRGDQLPSQRMSGMVHQIEVLLKQMGAEIFRGNARIDPYKKGSLTPCQNCAMSAICRIDPAAHLFRRLQSPAAEEASA